MAKAKPSARSLGMTVDDYVAKLPADKQRLVAALIALVRESAPGATVSIKWGQPVFEQNGPVCYVSAFKNHVNLGFWRGRELPTGKGILQSGGKMMAHVKSMCSKLCRASAPAYSVPPRMAAT